jgi:hypothetical protein
VGPNPRCEQRRVRRPQVCPRCEVHVFCELPVVSAVVGVDNNTECLERHCRIDWDEENHEPRRAIVTRHVYVRQVDSSKDLIAGCPVDNVAETRALAVP